MTSVVADDSATPFFFFFFFLRFFFGKFVSASPMAEGGPDKFRRGIPNGSRRWGEGCGAIVGARAGVEGALEVVD